MPLIVTPGNLASRGEFYFQLGTTVRAGLTLIQALEALEQKPPAVGYRRPIGKILAHLRQGNSFSSALHSLGRWAPPFDLALIEAGERSGRLDDCFKMLADYYESSARRIRQVIGRMLYPAGLLHFALLIFPIDQLRGLILEGNTNAFLMQKVATFLPAYIGVLVLVMLFQSKRFPFWRSIIEMIMAWIPFIGAARKALALGRLTAALEALINAGVNVVDSWELAASASGSPAILRTVRKWRPHIESGGMTPGELLLTSSTFPNMFASIYKSGEISGQIDDALRRLREYYAEESTRKLDVFTKALITIVVLGVMITVAYFIISFYAEYFKGIGDAIEDFNNI